MDRAFNYGELDVDGLKPMLSIDILNKMDVFISVEKMVHPAFILSNSDYQKFIVGF